METSRSSEKASEFLQTVEEVFEFYLDTTSAYQEFLKNLINAQKIVSEKTKLSIEDLDERSFSYAGNDEEKAEGNKQHNCKQRVKIAKELGIKKNDVKSDIMADIKYFRNSILKHKGKGNNEMKRCKILKWFKKGEEIIVSPEQFETIINIIRESLFKYS